MTQNICKENDGKSMDKITVAGHLKKSVKKTTEMLYEPKPQFI